METQKRWQRYYEPMIFVNRYVIAAYLCWWICIGFINYFISLHFHHVWCLNCVVYVVFSRRRRRCRSITRFRVVSMSYLGSCALRFCVRFFCPCLTRSKFNFWSMRCARDTCLFPRYTMPMLAYSLQMMNSRCSTLFFFSCTFLLIQLNCFNFSSLILFYLSLFFTCRRCLVHAILLLRSNVQFDLDFNTSWTRSLNYFEQCAVFVFSTSSINRTIDLFFFLSILF